MPVHPAGAVARHVRELVERQRLDALADSDLLVRFRADRDEAAFAALVRRHGPMVLGVCRRILISRPTTPRTPARPRSSSSPGRPARSAAGRPSPDGCIGSRSVACVPASPRPRPSADRTAAADVANPARGRRPGMAGGSRRVRHRSRPAAGRFRLPLVLCYLQGKTRAEAAADLGWTEGAVRGRLERGRKLLQARFVRRGMTLPAALVTLLAEDIGTAVAETAPTSTAARWPTRSCGRWRSPGRRPSAGPWRPR